MKQSPMPNSTDMALYRLRRLRVMALVEGTTLLALVGVAVPLKHLAGLPAAVSAMGPIHGMAFLLYFWMVFKTVSSDDWSKNEITRLVVAAIVPFGAVLSARFLDRKVAMLVALSRASLEVQAA